MKQAITILTALLCALHGTAASKSKVKLTPDKLAAAIGQKGYVQAPSLAVAPIELVADYAFSCNRLKQNLRALDKIGKRNDNNRAFGTTGYAASSDYVLSQITQKHDKEFKTWKQYFNHTYEETRNISVTGPDGEAVDVLSLMYNNATPLPAGVTGKLVAVPVDDAVGMYKVPEDFIRLQSLRLLQAQGVSRTNGPD
jgi:aminopeptidase Y